LYVFAVFLETGKNDETSTTGRFGKERKLNPLSFSGIDR
jgi:hypothetical protein